jgi:GTPase involved in cell partitioning and DNA repair
MYVPTEKASEGVEGIGDEFKFHLVKWSKICTLIISWGLRVKTLIQFNRALLVKWLWRYAREMESLWRLVVDNKCDSLRGG